MLRVLHLRVLEIMASGNLGQVGVGQVRGCFWSCGRCRHSRRNSNSRRQEEEEQEEQQQQEAGGGGGESDNSV